MIYFKWYKTNSMCCIVPSCSPYEHRGLLCNLEHNLTSLLVDHHSNKVKFKVIALQAGLGIELNHENKIFRISDPVVIMVLTIYRSFMSEIPTTDKHTENLNRKVRKRGVLILKILKAKIPAS